MTIQQIRTLVKTLSDLNIKYNYTGYLTQIKNSLTQLKTQRTSQLQQPNVNSATRQTQINTYKANTINATQSALTALHSIQNDLNDYSSVKAFNQLNEGNPYGTNAEILLNKIISDIDSEVDVLLQEFNFYNAKVTAYVQFANSTNSILNDLSEDPYTDIDKDKLILFFEGEANVHNLKELSKTSNDWNQIINCFGRVTRENNTEIEIISIEKGSLIETLGVAALIIGGIIRASGKVMDLILKVYEIRKKALELKNMQLVNISQAIEILEKEAVVNLPDHSKRIAQELLDEYGWNKSDELYNEAEVAAVKAVKKLIQFHNSGGKVDSKLISPSPTDVENISSIRKKNKELLSIEKEVERLTGSSKILQIEGGENEEEV